MTDDELVPYYKQCKALIFPGIEDFGLTMVEAQSFGKPVIAYKDGGALEIIKEDKEGDERLQKKENRVDDLLR